MAESGNGEQTSKVQNAGNRIKIILTTPLRKPIRSKLDLCKNGSDTPMCPQLSKISETYILNCKSFTNFELRKIS